jgi:hypothetical protein
MQAKNVGRPLPARPIAPRGLRDHDHLVAQERMNNLSLSPLSPSIALTPWPPQPFEFLAPSPLSLRREVWHHVAHG